MTFESAKKKDQKILTHEGEKYLIRFSLGGSRVAMVTEDAQDEAPPLTFCPSSKLNSARLFPRWMCELKEF